jgi:thiamine biosynthesis lipoprotein
MKQFAPAFKRCRPLLGTFVEISLAGTRPEWHELVEEAYQAIETVCSLMSFHDPESELSRLNRTPVGLWIRLSQSVIEVLDFALKLQRLSGGIFNVAIAQPLVFRDLLPGKTGNSGWKHLSRPGFELRGQEARRILPVQIDLGGIAKGYAVDRAVETIQARFKNVSGCVNAGGDMRVFGAEGQEIWIRAETNGIPVLRSAVLKNRSVATSSVRPSGGASAYIDIGKKKSVVKRKTATVTAEKCIVADALTKLAILGHESLAAKFGAEVSVFS